MEQSVPPAIAGGSRGNKAIDRKGRKERKENLQITRITQKEEAGADGRRRANVEYLWFILKTYHRLT
ncbi:MAG TPA: hypothetical protein DHU55_02280 [Blastocatellia bacterium]|nr:hypothetical protein [Blastocatellia bacterium]HAF22463.1 hypothetical protein [Blastocatellia bacterium]HCX28590.1 hypothetical protein [Blastocatellia bacterium]